MARQVVANFPGMGEWISARAKCPHSPRHDSTIGVVDGDVIHGGVILTCHTGSSCFMHAAGRDEKWLTRDLLWATFHYPFYQLGYARLFAIVESANGPALRFCLGTGFEMHSELPDMFASGPGILLTMERARCRWLRLTPRTIRG